MHSLSATIKPNPPRPAAVRTPVHQQLLAGQTHSAPDPGWPERPSSTSAIRAERLSKRYGETLALDALDLVVEPGEVYGYLRPNG